MPSHMPDPAQSSRQYRRGAVMGLTVAEAFMLLAFVLLMLMLLWRSEDARKLEAARPFMSMSGPERAGVERIVEAFRQAGLSPEDPALREKLGDLAAAGRTSPEVLAQLASADEPTRRKLEALIRSDTRRSERVDDQTDQTNQTDQTVAERVAGRLQSAAEGRARVTEALRRELGATVAAAGGEIDPDGALVFPDTVLFPAGKSDITPQLRAFLETICLPWFQTLERSGAEISDLRIEGHASTEWTGLSAEQAYLANLALSQARAHAVLSTCLELVPGPEGQWARSVATAVGYSSSHPVVVNGHEDQQKSRRVVFRVDYSQEGVLRDIQTDVDAAERAAIAPPLPTAPPREPELIGQPQAPEVRPASREAIPTPAVAAAGIAPELQTSPAAPPVAAEDAKPALAGLASIIEADTIEIHGTTIRLFGIAAPAGRQLCKDAAGEQYYCGQKAAMALADRIRSKTVTCAPKNLDPYGRTVAVCTVGGEDIGAWMVSRGFAFAYRTTSKDYVPIEEAAHRSAAGLWAGTFDFPWDVR